MEERRHRYRISAEWTGNSGRGTASYAGYERAYRLTGEAKPPIEGSADPAFRGDPACWNPEDLLVGSLAGCHQLWYLALCAQAGVIVTAYRDDAEGEMVEEASGAGQFVSVMLRPRVTIAPGSDAELAMTLHERAHHMCFIARSMNFPVRCEPAVTVEGAAAA